MIFKTQPIIKTKRLCLQAFRDLDQNALIGLLTNEEISKTYMTPVFHAEDEKVQAFQRLQKLSALEDRFVRGIYLNDQLIGFVNDVEMKDGEIELGYVIHPQHHNQGYATEVLAKAIEVMFLSGFSAVITGAFEGNRASMRVMEKCGMVRIAREDFIEYRGKMHRCIYYKTETNLPACE